ncbi:MAG: hypothetical protein U5R48_10050 [Gammaproteobacteria bacterium]|nr:hypothetical protein [Gammaproteobacteria bacterium]
MFAVHVGEGGARFEILDRADAARDWLAMIEASAAGCRRAAADRRRSRNPTERPCMSKREALIIGAGGGMGTATIIERV